MTIGLKNDVFARKLLVIYVALLVGTGLLMLLVLLTGESSLNYTMVIFLIVVKFIAGIGSVIGVISLIIWMLTKFASKYSGEENKKNLKFLLVLGVMIIIILVVYQGPVKIIQSLMKSGSGDVDNLLDKILFIYGIVSLLLSMYVLPLVRDQLVSVTTITTKDMIKDGLEKTRNTVKRWFHERKKEYGKAELITQMALKQDLQLMRQRLAVILLLPLGAGTLIFMPITVAMVLLWLRIFVFTNRKLFPFERVIAASACIAISVISAIMPFVLDLTPLYATIQGAYIFIYISQFCGLLIAALIYLVKLLKPIQQKRVMQKLKSVKEEKEALEKERKQLLKEKKALAKQVNNKPKADANTKKSSPPPVPPIPKGSTKKEKAPATKEADPKAKPVGKKGKTNN